MDNNITLFRSKIRGETYVLKVYLLPKNWNYASI